MRQVELHIRITMELKCPNCGNDDQDRFTAVTVPYVRDGRLIGYTLTGAGCMDCDTLLALDKVAA